MNKVSKKSDELRREYDLSALGRGIRGKHCRRAQSSTNVVLIEPDLMRLFPTGESVNRALRMLAETARAATWRKSGKP
jgi:hypothetical protein